MLFIDKSLWQGSAYEDMNISMKFLFVIGAVLILTARNGWALECRVCDSGISALMNNDGTLGRYFDIFTGLSDKTKFHFVEDACSENTPMTTCDKEENVCVTYKMIYFTSDSYNDLTYKQNLQQYRCGKEGHLTAHCKEYDDWHDEQYEKYKAAGTEDYYKGADIELCEPQITKKGKY